VKDLQKPVKPDCKDGYSGTGETLAALVGPVLIVDPDPEHSEIVARAVRQVCRDVVILQTYEDAREWLDCTRFHYVLICPTDDDSRSPIELLKYIGRTRYDLPVLILGEKDRQRRCEMRDIASNLGIVFFSFPHPIELGAVRVLLADRRSRTAGLPVAHMWGGVTVDSLFAQHRKKMPVKRAAGVKE